MEVVVLAEVVVVGVGDEEVAGGARGEPVDELDAHRPVLAGDDDRAEVEAQPLQRDRLEQLVPGHVTHFEAPRAAHAIVAGPRTAATSPCRCACR